MLGFLLSTTTRLFYSLLNFFSESERRRTVIYGNIAKKLPPYRKDFVCTTDDLTIIHGTMAIEPFSPSEYYYLDYHSFWYQQNYFNNTSHDTSKIFNMSYFSPEYYDKGEFIFDNELRELVLLKPKIWNFKANRVIDILGGIKNYIINRPTSYGPIVNKDGEPSFSGSRDEYGVIILQLYDNLAHLIYDNNDKYMRNQLKSDYHLLPSEIRKSQLQ